MALNASAGRASSNLSWPLAINLHSWRQNWDSEPGFLHVVEVYPVNVVMNFFTAGL